MCFGLRDFRQICGKKLLSEYGRFIKGWSCRFRVMCHLSLDVSMLGWRNKWGHKVIVVEKCHVGKLYAKLRKSSSLNAWDILFGYAIIYADRAYVPNYDVSI